MTTKLGTIEVAWDQTRVKAATAVQAGHRVLEFYAAAFTEAADTNGDVIDRKAFDGWLPEFYSAGQAMKISFNHAATLDPNDPTNTIGYAPADPDHVWVDDYGLRVKAYLDVGSEKGKAVEYQIEKKLLTGASMTYGYIPEETEKREDGANIITRITRVTESGLVPNPANQAAVLLWLKSEGMTTPDHDDEPMPYMTVEDFRLAVKNEEPDPLVVQARHDALVAQGAKCEHSTLDAIVEEVKKAEEESLPDLEAVKARNRKLRLIETSLP